MAHSQPSSKKNHFWESSGFRVSLVLFGLLAACIGGVLYLYLRHHFSTLSVVGGPLVGIVGTIIGSVLAFEFATSQHNAQGERSRASRREDLAFEMHREFASEVLLKSRAEADKFLREHPGITYRDLYDSFPEPSTRSLFHVSDFYERLSIAIDHHRVEWTLVSELFGPTFLWWYLVEFEDRLIRAQHELPVAKRLEALYHWFRVHADGEDFREWTSRAVKDRESRYRKIAVVLVSEKRLSS